MTRDRPGVSRAAACPTCARSRLTTSIPTSSCSRRGTASTCRATEASSGRRSRSSCPRSTPSRSGKLELAARDDLRRAADEDLVDAVAVAVDAGVERRRAPELDTLRDLDLLAERNPA